MGGVASEQNLAAADIQSYGKAARASAQTAQCVQTLIKETGAPCEVVALDKWNNLSRILDRSTCVLITAPSLLWWITCVRPGVAANIKYVVLFAIAFTCNILGQTYREANPCGFIIENGKRKVDPDYRIFECLHAMWHLLLILIFTVSALDRPSKGA